MSGKKLAIIEERVLSHKEQLEENSRAQWEKVWQEESDKLNPRNTARGRARLKRTAEFLSRLDLNGKNVADLGCGNGSLFPFLEGGAITALDISERALSLCPDGVKKIRRILPYSHLPEQNFDCVLLTEVLAEIEPHLHRLLLSEIFAIMKKEAFFICSTELDIYSEDALEQFLVLLQCEFEVIELKKSYHRLFFHMRRALDAPSRFVRAGRDEGYRRLALEKREGVFRLWFYLNSLKWLSLLWRPWIFLKKRVHSQRALQTLESLSKFVWGERGVTHVIALCKRKSLHHVKG